MRIAPVVRVGETTVSPVPSAFSTYTQLLTLLSARAIPAMCRPSVDQVG